MIWRAKNVELDLTRRALVMGILNVTLDSFSDGGKFLSVERAVEHALRMVEEGAAIIDVGGESTRPGAPEVPAEVEMERVLPVIEALARAPGLPGRPSQPLTSLTSLTGADFPLISIDTYKPEVARAAIERGAHIINDITGLQNPAMLEVARQTGAGAVIMHMQGTPRTMQIAPHYEDVVAEVRNFFRQSLDRAIASGLDPMCLAFDPGIGFGKTVAHNLELLRNLDSLRVSDRPLLVGVSNKSFIGKVIGSDRMEDRLWPTVALTSFAREKGANLVRVHEVKPNAQALRMTEAILETT
jgi:dihydropteroate synthase